MKSEIHPNYYHDAKITCACGAVYDVGSTVKEIKVEICSNCHPFYTGKQKLVDTARRVERFEAKTAKQNEMVQDNLLGKTAKKAKLKAKRSTKVAVRKTVKKIGGGHKRLTVADVNRTSKADKPKPKKTEGPASAAAARSK